MPAKKVDPREKMRKVAEVDAAKRKEADLLHEEQAKLAEDQKRAAMEAENAQEMAEQLEEWKNPDRPLHIHSEGNLLPDPTAFPDRVTLDDGTTRVLKQPGYVYRWTRFLDGVLI